MYTLKMEKYASDYKIPKENFYDIYDLEKKMKFVEDEYSGQNRELIVDKIRFLNIVGKIEKQQGKDLNKFNTVELADLFESLKIVNNASVSNRKNLIKQYFEWSVINKLIDITAVEQIVNLSTDKIQSDNIIDKLYFKDYEDLTDGNNTIIRQCKGDVNDDKVDLFIALTNLSWIGISITDAVLIKGTDIDKNNNIIHVGNYNIEVPQNIMSDIINRCHLTIFNDKLILLNILEKTAISDITTISEKDLLSRFSNFKKIINTITDKDNRFYGHSFTYDKIRKSGVFFRMYQYEAENNIEFAIGNAKELSELAYLSGLTPQKMNNWIANYRNWRSCFYNY